MNFDSRAPLSTSPIGAVAGSVPAKKVFYVIRCAGSLVRMAPDGTFNSTSSLASAVRFDTVADALHTVGNRAVALVRVCGGPSRPNLEIVRVEETSGTEQRVVLGETEAAPIGATVKYALKDGSGTGQYADAKTIDQPAGLGWSSTLPKARLFDTVGDALNALEQNAAQRRISVLGNNGSLVRVAIQPATPTFTETVLA